MRIFLIAAVLLTSLNSIAKPMAYPTSPDPKLTPGSLCDRPSEYRYPERIPYCEREVDGFLKEHIYRTYRRELGYRLNRDGSNFKVDHFIPLCAGGSNDESNLWPQHISVFTITDPIEALGCEKLSQGRIKQRDLIALVKTAKMDLKEAPKVLKYLRSLR